MHSSMISFAFLALAVNGLAAPGGLTGRQGNINIPSDFTTEQAQNLCGVDQTLNCCNKETESNSAGSGNGLLGGLLGGAGGGLSLFDGCSKLSVTGRKLADWQI